MSNQGSSAKVISQAKPGNEKAPLFMVPIFKLPVLLYQLRLGWLLGKRFMQLTHVGRRSGKVRKTILAVLRFDEATKAAYAVSAWKGSDWYYNIQSTSALQVEIASVRYVPKQQTPSPEEIATMLSNIASVIRSSLE